MTVASFTPLALSAGRLNRALTGLFLAVTAAGGLAELLPYVGLPAKLRPAADFANLSHEANLPTWYVSMLLLACALLLLALVQQERGSRNRWHWFWLAVAFLYISVDEMIVIHEGLNAPLREALGAGGALYFTWVLPFGAVALLVFVTYLGFLARLPGDVRLLFMAGGAVYVGGALGTELPVSLWYEQNGGDNLVYGLLNLWQESLEILGVTIFLSGLLAYLSRSPLPRPSAEN